MPKIFLPFAVVIFPVLLRITVPYGRHTRNTWGPMVNNRLGWFLMELPVAVVFSWFFFHGNAVKSAPVYVFYGLFMLHGGLFDKISSPNLLGEIIEWSGWALMSWCLPAFSFALWTIANLLPRALDHHRWYHRYFSDYPKNRKALFPRIL